MSYSCCQVILFILSGLCEVKFNEPFWSEALSTILSIPFTGKLKQSKKDFKSNFQQENLNKDKFNSVASLVKLHLSLKGSKMDLGFH